MRNGTQWIAEIPTPIDVTDRDIESDIDNSDSDDDIRELDRLARYDAEIDDLISESESTQDEFARADEDGWYYED